MSVTLMIFMIPLCCAIYVINEPKRTWPIRALLLVIWAGVMDFIEITIARFSQLQDHKSYYWLVAEIVFSVEIAITIAVVRWFFRQSSMSGKVRGTV